MPKNKGKDNAVSAVEDDSDNLASRVAKLEQHLKEGLKQLKNQISLDSAAANVSQYSDQISAFESTMQQAINSIKSEILNVQKQLNSHSKEIDNMKKERMLNGIVVHGMVEKEKESDREELCRIISSKLGVEIASSHINYCYRMGTKKSSKKTNRPLAVLFTNRWKRDEIFFVKKKLKNSGIVFVEMLTNDKLNLLKKARTAVGPRNCWSWKNNIYVNDGSGKRAICSENDLTLAINN